MPEMNDGNLRIEYVGKHIDDVDVEALRKQAECNEVRVIKPGQIITAEFNPWRLNLSLDDLGSILGATKG